MRLWQWCCGLVGGRGGCVLQWCPWAKGRIACLCCFREDDNNPDAIQLNSLQMVRYMCDAELLDGLERMKWDTCEAETRLNEEEFGTFVSECASEDPESSFAVEKKI